MSLYRPPKVYQQTLERRARDAQDTAQRQTRAGKKAVTEFMEAHDDMSEESRAFLLGLMDNFKKVTESLGGR